MWLDSQDTAAANIHLTTAASQPGQHAKRAADPRRESTVLFKGFSASSAESGLLEISEIADINGSPEIVRHQQSVPVPLEPHLGSASSPLRQSGQDTIHRTRASSANATSEALRISLSSSSHASLSEDSRDGGLAPINTTPSQLTPTASQAGAAQQLQQQEAHLLQEQHSHLQQQNQQSPQQQDQQHMQSPPLQHAIQQELATPVAAEGSLLHQAANAPASPSDSDTVPALDLECSSLRLQALAAANAPADEEGSGAGLGMPADQSGQRPAHTEVLLPVEVHAQQVA